MHSININDNIEGETTREIWLRKHERDIRKNSCVCLFHSWITKMWLYICNYLLELMVGFIHVSNTGPLLVPALWCCRISYRNTGIQTMLLDISFAATFQFLNEPRIINKEIVKLGCSNSDDAHVVFVFISISTENGHSCSVSCRRTSSSSRMSNGRIIRTGTSGVGSTGVCTRRLSQMHIPD